MDRVISSLFQDLICISQCLTQLHKDIQCCCLYSFWNQVNQIVVNLLFLQFETRVGVIASPSISYSCIEPFVLNLSFVWNWSLHVACHQATAVGGLGFFLSVLMNSKCLWPSDQQSLWLHCEKPVCENCGLFSVQHAKPIFGRARWHIATLAAPALLEFLI